MQIRENEFGMMCLTDIAKSADKHISVTAWLGSKKVINYIRDLLARGDARGYDAIIMVGACRKAGTYVCDELVTRFTEDHKLPNPLEGASLDEVPESFRSAVAGAGATPLTIYNDWKFLQKEGIANAKWQPLLVHAAVKLMHRIPKKSEERHAALEQFASLLPK